MLASVRALCLPSVSVQVFWTQVRGSEQGSELGETERGVQDKSNGKSTGMQEAE